MELGRFMTKLGAVGALGGGLALKPVVDRFTEYDDAIRAVGARTEATAEQFGRLDAAARELGRSTSFSAVEVAKLMNVLGTRGFNPDQVIAMSKSVLDLARATGVEAPLAADVLGAALKAFELDAADTTSVADKFTVAANKSAVSLETLGETFQYVAPVAKDLGISLDTTLALAGALSNVGIQGSEAGTALRRMGIVIASGDADLQRIFGVTGTDAAGNVRPIVDVLNDIQQSMAGLGNAAKATKLNEFFGLLGITSASALGKSTATVKELEEAIGASAGTAAKTAEMMDAGLGGGLRRLRGAVEGVVLAFGDAFAPILMTIAQALQLTSGLVREFIAQNQQTATAVAAVVVALIAGGAALAAFGLAFTAVGVGISAFISVVTFALSIPTSLIGALIIGIRKIATTLFVTSDTGKEMLGRLADGFKEFAATVSEAWEGITAAIGKGDLNLAFEIAMAGLKLEWQKVVLYWTELWVKFRNGFLNDLHNLALRIEGTFVWKTGKETGRILGKIGDTAVDAAEGVMRIPIGLWGLATGDDGPGGLAGAAAAAAAALPPPKPNTRIGTALGPVFGEDIGRIIGKSVTDAVNKELEVDPLIRGKRAEIDALKAELDALNARAKAPVPGAPGNGYGGGGDFDLPGGGTPIPQRPEYSLGSVRGGFAVPSGRLQFGIGDSFQKKQLDKLDDIKDGKGQLPEKIGKALQPLLVFGS